MWITGRSSKRATSQLGAMVWKITPNVGKRLD